MSIHKTQDFKIEVEADLGTVRWDNFKLGTTACFFCGKLLDADLMLMWAGTGASPDRYDSDFLYLHYACVPRFCDSLITDWDACQVRDD